MRISTVDCLQPIYPRERKANLVPRVLSQPVTHLSSVCRWRPILSRFPPRVQRSKYKKIEGCEQSIPRGITIHFCHQHTITMTKNSLTLHKQKLRLNICRFLETQFSNFNLLFFYYITEEAYRG